MRTLAIWLTLAALAGATTRPLPGGDSAAAHKQIEANYEKVKKATLAHSVEAINECRKEIESDDAIFIDSKGDIYPIRPVGSEYAAFAQSVVSYEYTIKKFALADNEAEVWVDVKEVRRQVSRPGVRSRPVRERQVVSIEHTKDTWTLTPAGWKRKLREEVAPAERTTEDEPAAAPTSK